MASPAPSPALTNIFDTIAETLALFRDGLQVAVDTVGLFVAGVASSVTAVEQFGQGVRSVLGTLGQFAANAVKDNPAAGIVTGLAGVFGQLTQSIQGVVGTLGQFVQAISPSTMLAFSQAMRDVQATIGSAFTGAVQIVTSVVREIGGILLPVMQKLTPIVNVLANAFGTVLTAQVRVLATLLDALAPILELVADLMGLYANLLSDLLGIVAAAIRTISTVLQTFFGGTAGDIKDVFKGFLDVIRQVVKALVTFAATLAVFAGFRDTVRAFGVAIAKEARDREERAAGLKAAANNPAISDVLSIGKQQQQASFIAAGGAGSRDKSDTEYLKEMAKALDAIAGRNKSLEEAMKDWWEQHVLVGQLGEWLRNNDGLRGALMGFGGGGFGGFGGRP
jgi:hypothetical protein